MAITFILSFLIILIGILKDKKSFSLNKIYWYFMLFFMLIAPLIQYLTNYDAWGYHLTNENYIKINILIILFNAIYLATRNLMNKRRQKKSDSKDNSVEKNNTNALLKIEYTKRGCVILMILSIISFLIAISIMGFSSLFTTKNNTLGLKDGTLNTILTNLMRIIPVYFSAYTLKYFKCKKKGIVFIVLASILTILLNFPTGVTRYWIGTIYIGLMLIAFDHKLRTRSFDIIVVVSLLIIFPIFQTFKWNNINDLISGNAKINTFIEAYDNVDFDAYSMLGRTIQYTKENGHTYGNQLLGSIMFIIPRKIWHSKPIPSGELVASYQGQDYTNLSCPLIAEGYIDFGLLGIISFSILIAILIFKIDEKFIYSKSNSLLKIIYPFSMGLLLFTLRGALHPAVVFTFIFFIPIIAYAIIIKIQNKIKKDAFNLSLFNTKEQKTNTKK